MMKAKFRKLTALLLAILTVLSGSVLGVSAADDGQSVTDQTIDEIRELFNYEPLPNGAGQVAPIRGEYKATDELGGNSDASEE